MNLHTIMNSTFSLSILSDTVLQILSDPTNSVINEAVLKASIRHPSRECMSINMSGLIQTFFDDELMPKNEKVYDELCTALMANTKNEIFQYEEIEFKNRKEFFEGCTYEDLAAYLLILITEYVAYVGSNTICQYMVVTESDMNGHLQPLRECTSLKDTIRRYTSSNDSNYPALLAFVTVDAEITLEELEILKDILIITKVDNMALNNRTMISLAFDNINLITKDAIVYHDGRTLDTSKFKDSDLEICKFLYYITRDGIELNSIPNITNIFNCLKAMIPSVNKQAMNDIFNKFLYYQANVTELVSAYLQRLAVLNNESLKNKKNLISVTFNYEDRELFTIVTEKAA